jgi:hypothetical protein
MAQWTQNAVDVWILSGQMSLAEIDLYEGDSIAAYHRIDREWRQRMAMPFTRLTYVRARALSLRGIAAVSACQSSTLDPSLIRAATRDARGLRSMRLAWTDALAQLLEASVSLVTATRTRGADHLARAHTECSAAGMTLHAAVARRRLGELTGGSEGARAIAEADACLANQNIRAPQRFARLYMPELP